MDFLILRPLSPKTGYHFFEGGVGVGVWWGGGQKFSLRRLQAVGKPFSIRLPPADEQFSAGGSNTGPCTVAGGGGTVLTRAGFEPPTGKTRVGCAIISPY